MALKKKTSKPNLKNEVAEFKKQRILEEATKLFYLEGYESATLEAVATRLDVTKPFIYSYFKNKGELLFAICQTGIQLSQKALDSALMLEGTATEKLKHVVERAAHIVLEYQEYIVVYVREEKNLQPKDGQKIRQLRNEFDHRLASLLEEGNQTGEFSVANPLMTATTIGGMVSWLAFWFNPQGSYTASEILLNTNQLVLKMLMADSSKNIEK
jgi:AcrR family transcriptional regulator